ncbi:P-loop containing nucleoside triphosphate hydrolase protein [Mycena sp. CBHHK59/15]|nr:P-loop containing nucleoside triphosphate hydrolase protein [Mycena sp. CBHHK59/15]
MFQHRTRRSFFSFYRFLKASAATSVAPAAQYGASFEFAVLPLISVPMDAWMIQLPSSPSAPARRFNSDVASVSVNCRPEPKIFPCAPIPTGPDIFFIPSAMSGAPSEWTLSVVDLNGKSHSRSFPEYEKAPWQVRLLMHLRVPFVSNKSSPPTIIDLADAEIIPEANSGFFSKLTFGWMTPIMSLGYARPLEACDLYKLQDERTAAVIGDKILESFARQRRIADEYNAQLADGNIKPGWRALWWTLKGDRATREKKWRESSGKRQPSLVYAMNDSVKWWFWSSGILKLFADVAQITTPLIVGAIIDFSTDSYDAHQHNPRGKIPPISKGIGLALGLAGLQLITSLCQHHAYYRSISTGVLLRGGLITALYKQSLRLTSRARATVTNGKLITHVGTDVSRIDFCAGYFHPAWTAPIQTVICLVQLLVIMGPSALAGFSVFFLCFPAQSWLIKFQFYIRNKSMRWTDKRITLISEILSGINVIKYVAWEKSLLDRLVDIRKNEIRYVYFLMLIRWANSAVAFSFPVIASVLAFITYSLSGHTMTANVVFTSLTLFQLLRVPMMMLPVSFGGITDAYNAVTRIYPVFMAETLEETRSTNPELNVAVDVKGGAFTWDGPPPADNDVGTRKKKKTVSLELKNSEKPEPVFTLQGVNLSIPKGKLYAIVGSVGSGKSSLLQALIGEMRRTAGSVEFGGSVSYCPQSAWIQNATIRDNICFGRPYEPERYWKAVRDSCLEADFEMFTHGDMTEVGEKGISLSGGQKQRINVCRAVYRDADIMIFDDPLSALDAHVGNDVFRNVLQAPGKTRILVTHALHVLPQTDFIITLTDGAVVQQGTYAELEAQATGAFSKLVKEFDIHDSAKDEGDKDGVECDVVTEEPGLHMEPGGRRRAAPALMQEEDRETGAVASHVYSKYVKAGKGKLLLLPLIVTLVLAQATNVVASYWLIYWEEVKWPEPQSFYMGIYAGLGILQAGLYFLMGTLFAILTYHASQELHRVAIQRIMHAPMSFFETTPIGRITNRFSKDIDTMDNDIGDNWSACASTLGQITGALILIAIIVPYFLVPIAVISVCYFYISIFYRASARELKRLDSVLRSALYTHFAETLSGLPTIRAYEESARFKVDNETRVDNENRSYWLTVSNQRWLALRLDVLGMALTFIVALLAVTARFTISPSQTGIMLSYILVVQQVFSQMVRLAATIENDMNSVERILHYADDIEQEAPHHIEGSKPPPTWPSEGRMEFNDIHLAYRPGLPPVLKGLTMHIAGGEKIGIVGRTGAGKSSIMVALYRLVELAAGSITIDGLDISKLGLVDLRQSISIIPQSAVLCRPVSNLLHPLIMRESVSGTLRSNLDPFGTHDDTFLWDVLKQSFLVDGGSKSQANLDTEKDASSGSLGLDTVIEGEGSNLSFGQRSLVSLARAMAKNSKVLVLDEATASVDYETDKKIQESIAQKFHDRTILCIAHRLHTIIWYDRICVLDAGKIAELDTPMNLYTKNGIFRSMCDEFSISLEDITSARERYKFTH